MLVSRDVVRRKRNGRRLRSAVTIPGDPVVQAVHQYFTELRGEGQPAADYAAVFTDIGNAIDADLAHLEQADWKHLEEAANDRRLRRLRDTATAVLQRTLTNISAAVDGAYAKGAAEEVLGLGPGLRKEPELMLEAASQAIAKLSAPDFQFPDVALGGIQLEPPEIRTQIEGPHGDLAESISRLNDEQKKFDATLDDKLQAIDRFDKTYSRCANLLKALFGFAGKEMLAKRIRPTTRRRRPTADDTEPVVVEPDTDQPIPTDPEGDEPTPDGPDGDTPAEPTPTTPQELVGAPGQP